MFKISRQCRTQTLPDGFEAMGSPLLLPALQHSYCCLLRSIPTAACSAAFLLLPAPQHLSERVITGRQDFQGHLLEGGHLLGGEYRNHVLPVIEVQPSVHSPGTRVGAEQDGGPHACRMHEVRVLQVSCFWKCNVIGVYCTVILEVYCNVGPSISYDICRYRIILYDTPYIIF